MTPNDECPSKMRERETNGDDLGTGVMRTSATRLEQLAVLPGGHPKVGDLDVLLSVKQEVLRSARERRKRGCRISPGRKVANRLEDEKEEDDCSLEVSVADIEPMAVVDGMDDLLEVVESLCLGKGASLDKVLEEFAALDVFHDDEAVQTASNIDRSVYTLNRE
jgi:hypothetical protein